MMSPCPRRQKSSFWLVLVVAAMATLAPISSAPAWAGVVEGVVQNGTTGLPQPHQTVILIKLQGGMEPVATTQSDANGHFRLDNVDSSSPTPYLLRVTYGGAAYFQPVVFGGRDQVEAEVKVYETSAKPTDLSFDIRAIRLEPAASGEGDPRLKVEEWWDIWNRSQPPATFYQRERTFRFYVPGDRLTEPNISVESSTGMPITQGAIALSEPDAFGVDYPLKPGRTRIHIAYEVNYRNGQADFTSKSDYPVKSLLVLVPRGGVEVTSGQLRPAGEDDQTGVKIYSAGALRAREALQLQLKGFGETSAASAAEESASPVRRVPNAVSRAQWYILVFTSFILGMALVHLYRHDQTRRGRSVATPKVKPRRKQGPDSRRADA